MSGALWARRAATLLAIATAFAVDAAEPRELVAETLVDDTPPQQFEATPGGFPEASSGVTLAGIHPVTPARLLDTRDGTGVVAAGALGEGASIPLVVVGRGRVPATGVEAVVLNVTVTDSTSPSYLTVWPSGTDRPVASSLNMLSGQTVANLVVAKVGAGGTVSIFNAFGSTHVIADVVGWSGSEAFLHSFAPARILDTREGIGAPSGPVGPDSSIDLTVAGITSVPASGVDAVVLNVTVTEATSPSFVTVWPAGQPRPLASSLNMRPGETNPNMVISKVGANGKVSIYNLAGSTHIVIDIVGWMPIGGAYTSINPTRVLDTRTEFGTYGTFLIDPRFGPILRPRQLEFDPMIRPGETIQVQVAEPIDLPPSATAVVLNVTGTEPSAATYVTAWGFGASRPLASSLNLAAGDTRPNLVVAEVGAGGYVSLYNHSAFVHLVVDVVGYFEARNIQDDLDEIAGPQWHVLHVVPSDAAPLYGEDAIRHTLDIAESWLESNGGRGFRFDTAGGVVEVSTLHIGRTRAEILAVTDAFSFELDRWLAADGFGVSGKLYLVYVDGVATGGLCGLGGGQYAEMFTAACGGEVTGARPNTTGTWTTLLSARTTVHEALHVLGAVSPCAPDYGFNGHVNDPADVLYFIDVTGATGELEPGRRSVLDQGRNDYWGQGDSTCNGEPWPDVSLSPFLDAP